METKTPAKGFVRALQLMDDQLSVRWGPKIHQWVIERKAYIPTAEIEYLRRRKARAKQFFNHPPEGSSSAQRTKHGEQWEQVSEELASARTNKRIIMFTKYLSPQVYNQIAAADIRRYGGYARFADALENKETSAEVEAERILQNKRHAYNQEVASMMHHVWNKQEDGLMNREGKTDLRWLLHGKKTQPGDEPLIKLTDF